MKSNRIFGILGILLVLAGLFMPTGWYDPLPQREALATPAVSGLLLFQISLLAEGLFLIGLPALALGTWAGLKLFGRLNEASFRRVVLLLLLLSGVSLLFRL
jgi:hypothetical protein